MQRLEPHGIYGEVVGKFSFSVVGWDVNQNFMSWWRVKIVVGRI
jgi:hypothetical protein